jgi:protein MNN4
MFIIYLSTTLLDAILYSFLGYITGISVNLRIRYKNVYNVAIYSMTLPIILNLIYMIVNILTGYTIKYFSILYMAITCIYVIAAILIIRSEIIKKQIELSKILEEQEKVRQEIEEKERQKKEEEEKEKIRKKDEKERQEQKKKKQENKKTPKTGENPEPQANIKTEEF